MFLIHLKADLPFREEEADLVHPISTLHVLGNAGSPTFYVIPEIIPFPSTSQPCTQPATLSKDKLKSLS